MTTDSHAVFIILLFLLLFPAKAKTTSLPKISNKNETVVSKVSETVVSKVSTVFLDIKAITKLLL